jgi:HEAT repeat protein
MKDNEIDALIERLETTQAANTLWQVAKSLEKIGTGNLKVIEGLIKVLETTQYDYTRTIAAKA